VNMHRVSVVIAALDPVLCGLTAILSAEGDFNVVASCRDGASCVEAIRDLSPNLALLDASLPGQSAFQVLAAIKSEHLCTQVVFLSSGGGSGKKKPIAWHRHGVIRAEYVQQPLLDFLRQIASRPGESPTPESLNRHRRGPQDTLGSLSSGLTERERQIMHLVCEGWSNKEVGRELTLSEGTVKVHLHHIYQKLAIRNRTALAASAARSGEQSSWAQGRTNRAVPSPSARLGGGTQALEPTHAATSVVRKSRAAANVLKIANAQLPDE
jgi:two-component system nitrate/nitrite response regulator NarL